MFWKEVFFRFYFILVWIVKVKMLSTLQFLLLIKLMNFCRGLFSVYFSVAENTGGSFSYEFIRDILGTTLGVDTHAGNLPAISPCVHNVNDESARANRFRGNS
jgi:hypothetical protein